MSEALPHSADFQLVQRCLDGDVKAIGDLQRRFRPPLEAYLRRAGASEEEVSEVIGHLWADCLTARPGHAPRLANYAGNAALRSWLHPVILNRLLACKRRQQQWEVLHAAELKEDQPELSTSREPADERLDAPLLDLMQAALQAAFLACPPRSFVLLQLAHTEGLRLVELKRLFGSSKSKIDRDLISARQKIAAATLAYIQRTDPWLELKWKDFVELCQVATPACFGLE